MPGLPDEELERDAFELSLDEMLERVSAATRDEWAAGGGAEPPPKRRAPPPLHVDAGATAPTGSGTPGRRLALVLLASCALGGLALRAWRPPAPATATAVSFERLPPPAVGPARPSTRPPAEPETALAVAVDAEASTESLMIEQFNGGAGPARPASAAFAVARYDALRAAAGGWRVVAPLNVEAVYALVRTDSPLRDLGELRGRRINVGAPGSARATSGAALYRALFAQALPATPLGPVPRDEALHALLEGRGLDALLLFDGQPSAWIESLPEKTRRRLRLLSVDPHDAAGRRALQTWLPATVSPALAGDRATVATLGEVSFLIAGPQAARPERALRALCERLPSLRARGHPAWREVDPSVQLPLDMARASGLEPWLPACRPSLMAVSPVSSLTGVRP